jgi:hypothetical protein
MRLWDTIRLHASIGSDATKVLHKKIGKGKGLQSIEDQIRDTATRSAEKSFGGSLDRVAKKQIDEFVGKRMKFMKKAFRKLDNPRTDTSKQRGDFIGDTETKTAEEFGKERGFFRRARQKKIAIFKRWKNNEDSCATCQENADEGPIPVGDEFPSGDLAPLAHPGCECELEYTDEDGNPIDTNHEEEGEE